MAAPLLATLGTAALTGAATTAGSKLAGNLFGGGSKKISAELRPC